MELSDEMKAIEADEAIQMAAHIASVIGTYTGAIDRSAAFKDLVNWANSHSKEGALKDRLVELLDAEVDMNQFDWLTGAYLRAIQTLDKKKGVEAGELVLAKGKNLMWTQQMAERLVNGHSRFETPKNFYAHLIGSGEGCDYMIGCNQKMVKLKAQYREAAYDEIRELFEYYGGEARIKSITLINYLTESVFDAVHIKENA